MPSNTTEETVDDGPTETEPPSNPEPTFPPAPTIDKIETKASAMGAPNWVYVTVSAYPKRGPRDGTTTAKVSFKINNGTAELRGADSNLRFKCLLPAIITAAEKVIEHPQIKEVKSIKALVEEEREFIDKCLENEDS